MNQVSDILYPFFQGYIQGMKHTAIAYVLFLLISRFYQYLFHLGFMHYYGL